MLTHLILQVTGEIGCWVPFGEISGPLYGHTAPVVADRAAQRARWVEAGGFLGAEKSSTMCWGSCCTRDQLWFVTNRLSSLLNRKSTLLQRKDSAEREESSTVVRTPGINLSKMYLQNTYGIFFCINEKYAAAWQGTSFHQLRFIRRLIFFQLPMSFPELTAKNPP